MSMPALVNQTGAEHFMLLFFLLDTNFVRLLPLLIEQFYQMVSSEIHQQSKCRRRGACKLPADLNVNRKQKFIFILKTCPDAFAFLPATRE